MENEELKNVTHDENQNEDNRGEKKRNKLLIVALVICIPLFTFLGIFIGNKLINGDGTIGDFDVCRINDFHRCSRSHIIDFSLFTTFCNQSAFLYSIITKCNIFK